MAGILRSIVFQAGAIGLTLTVAGAARAEVKDVSASGFTIENSQVVPIDAKTAWNALVNDVGQWWPKTTPGGATHRSCRSSHARAAASSS